MRQVNDTEEKDTCDNQAILKREAWVNQAIPKRDQSERRPFALF